jgi:hypothetical protein
MKISNKRIVAGSILATLLFLGPINKPKAGQPTSKIEQKILTENIKLDQIRALTTCLVYVTHSDNSDKEEYAQKARKMLLMFPRSYNNVSSYFFGLAKGYMHGIAVRTRERYSHLTEEQVVVITAGILFNRAECTKAVNENS